MCLQANSKSRRLFAIASGCLAVGLLLPTIFHPTTPFTLSLLEFTRGLLLGVSMTVNLSMVWINSRQRRIGSGPRL
jgi:hypothetical protein